MESRPSPAEVLGFIAKNEPLERTLERFPGLSRDELRALLREAAVLMRADEQGVELQEAPPFEARPPVPSPVPAPPVPATAAPAAGEPAPSAGSAEPARRLRVYSDGAARGNPGPAGAGAVLMKPDGTLVAQLGKYLGIQTNNHAEYTALLLGLKAALKLGANEVEVFADSQLLIRQLEGAYKVKSETLRPLFDEARQLLRQFRRVKLQHVPRELNSAADEMSNRAIDERM